ncbi:hypothetical protein [uncultured Bacteroides sp.]|uniref:hypothetical protein n=1 Tax=uncultured Bacteroides sp. TaxID=162156 RepID=UPI002AA5ECFF|nr:hypothetical protein [uncultured Bacteroides sp.]
MKLSIQLLTACLLTAAGCVFLFVGLWMPPVGELHPSVLVAFGEIMTFAGSLFGIDYHYRSKKSN